MEPGDATEQQIDTGSVAPEPESEEVEAFWNLAKVHARLQSIVPSYFGPTPLEVVPPPAWSFGAEADVADELAALVLAGTKTATASALWDYEAEGGRLPEPGDMGIVLDGSHHPVALIVTTQVDVVPFDQVDAEHARLEGEGDLSLEGWRRTEEKFFTEHAVHDHGFSPDMPVVCERFKVLYPQ